VLTNIDINAGLSEYAGPGGWNDPCLLMSDTWQQTLRVSEQQSRSQFSMWAVMASPLLISGNIRNMSQYVLDTYKNAEVIAVSQDSLGKQGRRIQGGPLAGAANATNIWARPLQHGAVAAVFLNNAETDQQITCGNACFTVMGFKSGQTLQVRDLWARSDLPELTLGPGTTFTPNSTGTAQGGANMVLFKTKAVGT
jgi:alpha-galactosidase